MMFYINTALNVRWGHCLERGGTLLFGPKGCVPLNMVWVQQKTNSKSAKNESASMKVWHSTKFVVVGLGFISVLK